MELTPGIWKAASAVGSGISLIAFLGAVAATWHAKIHRDKLKTIEQLKGEHLLEAFDTMLVGMHVPTAGLTREQRFELAHRKLDQAYKRYRLLVVLVFMTAAMVITLAAFSVHEFHQQPSHVEELNRLMVMEFEQSQYDDAEALADKILQEQPKHVRALDIKGCAAAFRQDYRTAVRYFQEVYEQDKSITYKRNLAYALLHSGRVDEATKLYEELRNGSPEADLSVAFAYVAGEKYDKAIQVLESLPTNAGPPPTVKNATPRGQSAVLEAAALMGRNASGDKEKAIEKLQFGIAQDPRYWPPILQEKEKDPNNDYEFVLPLVRSIVTNAIR